MENNKPTESVKGTLPEEQIPYPQIIFIIIFNIFTDFDRSLLYIKTKISVADTAILPFFLYDFNQIVFLIFAALYYFNIIIDVYRGNHG